MPDGKFSTALTNLPMSLPVIVRPHDHRYRACLLFLPVESGKMVALARSNEIEFHTNPKEKIMSKNNALNSLKTVAVILFMLAIFFPSSVAYGQQQTNPARTEMVIYFVRNGVEDQEAVTASALWLPTRNPWNDRFASNGTTRIENVAEQVVPNAEPVFAFPAGTKKITTDEVNVFFDNYYSGSQRIGEPTWNENCHGHSTRLGYWVNRLNTLIAAGDWVPCASMSDVKENCLHGNASHSIKVTRVVSYEVHKVVSKTTEKNGYSGTYEHTYYLPGGASIGVANTYKPKQ
jgi:hypothetical protein